MTVQIVIDEMPTKLVGEATMSPDAVEQQFRDAREALVFVADDARGTCGDERPRAGLLNGEPTVEDRPSAWGGPNIQALYMAELSGFFGDSDLPGKDRLIIVTKRLNAKGIPSGGHKGCAANAGFNAVIGIIASQGNQWMAAAQTEMGDEYDPEIAAEVDDWARQVVSSGRYEDWDESILEDVLGDEAGEAIELLQEGPHTGRTRIRVKIPGKTVSQNKLHEITGGEDSFVQDDPYCARIENALAEGPNASHTAKVMRHAREALLYAIERAVPNTELHGGKLQ